MFDDADSSGEACEDLANPLIRRIRTIIRQAPLDLGDLFGRKAKIGILVVKVRQQNLRDLLLTRVRQAPDLLQNLLKPVRPARRLETRLTLFGEPRRCIVLPFVAHSRFDHRQNFVHKETTMQPDALLQPVYDVIRNIFQSSGLPASLIPASTPPNALKLSPTPFRAHETRRSRNH
jgi:hypothetical protein